MTDTTVADLFGVNEVGHAQTRYTLEGARASVKSGGIVSAGRASGQTDGPGQLVHTGIPGRREQAIDMGAVASALTGGVIPLPQLVALFASEGTLDALKQAVAQHGK